MRNPCDIAGQLGNAMLLRCHVRPSPGPMPIPLSEQRLDHGAGDPRIDRAAPPEAETTLYQGTSLAEHTPARARASDDDDGAPASARASLAREDRARS